LSFLIEERLRACGCGAREAPLSGSRQTNHYPKLLT